MLQKDSTLGQVVKNYWLELTCITEFLLLASIRRLALDLPGKNAIPSQGYPLQQLYIEMLHVEPIDLHAYSMRLKPVAQK